MVVEDKFGPLKHNISSLARPRAASVGPFPKAAAARLEEDFGNRESSPRHPTISMTVMLSEEIEPGFKLDDSI